MPTRSAGMSSERSTVEAVLTRIASLETSLERAMASLTRIEKRLDHEAPRLHATTYRAIESLLAVYRHIAPSATLPRLANPFGGWAISADMARLVCELFLARQPSLVVELGSGASTVVLGHLAASHDGPRIVSLEHDAIWYADTLEQLTRAGLTDFVDLRFAPLEPIMLNGKEYLWYSMEALNELNGVEMLLVDGPPGHIGPSARYPAGPVLAPITAPGCLWIVDDIVREPEHEMVARWERELDVTMIEQLVWHAKGAALMESRGEQVTGEA